MKPPIFIATANGLMIFESASAASGYLEPIDVENGEYASAWDREGRRLTFAVGTERRRRRWFGERVDEVVVLREEEAVRPDELRDALRAFAADDGLEIPATASLDVTIALVRERSPYGVLMQKQAT